MSLCVALIRCVALLRVSTAEQEVISQRRAIERWAAAQDPPAEVDYREEVLSGAARSRPVIEAILEDARAGRLETLVVSALDRIGRSAVETIVRLDELRRLGVRVVSLREALDFGTPVGALVASVLAHVAEMERAAIRERVRAGLAGGRDADGRRVSVHGRVLGRPRHQWTAEEIAELEALVADGLSLERIARDELFRVFVRRRRPDGAEEDVAVVPSASAMRAALRAAREMTEAAR